MGILSKLKNGDTVFRSLSYGKDRPNGGSSNAPYIQTPLPGLDQDPGPPNVEDSILRGSLKAPISAKDDVLRLTKYLFDIKNIDGFLFTTKQNILSRIAPKAENAFGPAYGGFSKLLDLNTGDISFNPNSGFFNEGIYTPLSTILQAGVGYLGTHYDKQGLDPTGNFPNLSIKKYGEVAYQNNLPENNNYNNVVPLSLWKGWMKKGQQVDRLGIKVGDATTAYYEQVAYQPTPPIIPVRDTPGQLLVNSKGVPNFVKNLPQTVANIRYIGDKAKYAVQKTKYDILEKWDSYQEKRKLEKKVRADYRYARNLQQYRNLENQVNQEANTTRYDNRLLQLWRKGGLDSTDPGASEYNQILYSYSGGPDSTLGIGNTTIKTGTLNDGITPARTGVLRGNDPYFTYQNDALEFKRRPVTFSTSNIFENTYGLSRSFNNSVSLIYASLVDVSDFNLFSYSDYLEVFDGKEDINSPWTNNLEDKLRYSINRYRDPYGLKTITQTGLQIPLTKEKVITLDTGMPFGATSKFIEIYNKNEDWRIELERKTTLILNEDPYHQTRVLASHITPSALDNRASEKDDPYTESDYSKDLTPNQKLYPDVNLDFTAGTGVNKINFDKYYGATKIYNQSGSLLNDDSSTDTVNDPSFPNPSDLTYKDPPKEYNGGQTWEYKNLDFTTGSSGKTIVFNKYTGASKVFTDEGTIFDQNNNSYSLLTDSEFNQYTGSKLGNHTIKDDIPNDIALRNQIPNRSDINLRISESFNSKFSDSNPHPSYKRTREEETARNPSRFPRIRHEQRVHTGEPGQVTPSYRTVLDSINARGVYSSTSGKGSGAYSQGLNDFVHFRIGIVDSRSNGGTTWYMNFRSYIDSFSDSFNSTWTDVRYMGRGEAFKRYDTFSRTINMSWTIAATSQAEMYGIYDKLRLLATSIAPVYVNGSYMSGCLAKLTVGGYVSEQWGIITGFTYEIPQEASWEIIIGDGSLIGDELPMMIKVTGFQFTPVYDFIPQMTNDENFRWISKNIPNPGKIASSGIQYDDPTYDPASNPSSDIKWNDNPAATTNPSGATSTPSSP